LIRVLRRFRRKIMWVKNCIKAPPFIDGWMFVCNSLPIIIRAVIHSKDGAIAYVQAGKPACGS
jgi:hypothetical protein